jgi:hypothetical protein
MRTISRLLTMAKGKVLEGVFGMLIFSPTGVVSIVSDTDKLPVKPSTSHMA